MIWLLLTIEYVLGIGFFMALYQDTKPAASAPETVAIIIVTCVLAPLWPVVLMLKLGQLLFHLTDRCFR